MNTNSLVALMIVRNEIIYIENQLNILSKFCDKICIIDDGSIDGSQNIYKKFGDNVIVNYNTKNANDPTNFSFLRQRVLDMGREFSNKFLVIDSDEFFTPSVLKYKDEIIKDLNHYSAITNEFIWLWGSTETYRSDIGHPFNNQPKTMFFRDSGANYSGNKIHEDRIPMEQKLSPIKYMPQIKVLHYACADLKKWWEKQEKYKEWEIKNYIDEPEKFPQYKSVEAFKKHIADKYSICYEDSYKSFIKLDKIPADWKWNFSINTNIEKHNQ